jgi:hypothetical protein
MRLNALNENLKFFRNENGSLREANKEEDLFGMRGIFNSGCCDCNGYVRLMNLEVGVIFGGFKDGLENFFRGIS